MNFWISGIVEAEVGDAFWRTMKTVQNGLNLFSGSEKYGTGVKEMNIIFVISKDDIKEYRRFMKASQSLEARIRIAYDEFRDASDVRRIKMFTDALVVILQKTNSFDEYQLSKQNLIKDIQAIM